MKKWLFCLACLGVVAALSGEGLAGRDVATLEPVQTVYLAADGGVITLQTDTGAKGSGKNLDAALENLHQTTSSIVFLDTAEYLLVDPKLTHLITSMQHSLRPSCRICLVNGRPDVEQAGAFLKTHQPATTMKDYLAGKLAIPTLKRTGEAMQLVP